MWAIRGFRGLDCVDWESGRDGSGEDTRVLGIWRRNRMICGCLKFKLLKAFILQFCTLAYYVVSCHILSHLANCPMRLHMLKSPVHVHLKLLIIGGGCAVAPIDLWDALGRSCALGRPLSVHEM